MGAVNNKTRKRSASSSEAPPPLPELSDEIVVEILVRLPVKYLLRCTSVCKAWRAIVSDPVFIHTHLRSSASRCEQDPAFLITPITFDPGEASQTTFSSHIRFYQWQQGAPNGGKAAMFKHAKDFAGEFNQFCYFAHCDGLVLAPTDTKLYLFNPATRDTITLPDSERNDLRNRPRACHCTGLGRDPHTGKYKVVQAFFRAIYAGVITNVHLMGMEVLTIGGDAVWRETTRPPYPVVSWQPVLHIKGFMYWRIDGYHHEDEAPRGLLRLSLADESFHVTGLPDPDLDLSFSLEVLHGQDQELCLTACTGDESLTVWTMKVDDGGGQGQWEKRYNIRSQDLCHPMALVAGGSRLLLRRGCVVYGHDLAKPEAELSTACKLDRIRYQGRRGRRWKNLWIFNVTSGYTESLVRPSFSDSRGGFSRPHASQFLLDLLD